MVSILLLTLTGCGGGGETSSPGILEGNTDVYEGFLNVGGTPSNPNEVSFNNGNEINVDYLENYFTFNLESDSKVYISAILELGMKTLDKTRCVSKKVEESGFIKIDGVGVACDHRAVVDLSAGKHTINFEYPRSNYGYFTIDKVTNDQRAILTENGSGGLPSSPRTMSLSDNNEINKDLNYNYFAYQGKAGDKLFLNAYLEETVPTLMFTRCRSRDGEGRSAIGFSINGSAYSCTESLEYELPEDGSYYVHVFFMAPSDVTYPVSGYFRADVQYAN